MKCPKCKEEMRIFAFSTVIIVSLLFFILATIWIFNCEDYKSDIKTTCEDKDGDIIEGQICYKTFKCSDKIKFFNEDGCEQFVLSGDDE